MGSLILNTTVGKRGLRAETIDALNPFADHTGQFKKKTRSRNFFKNFDEDELRTIIERLVYIYLEAYGINGASGLTDKFEKELIPLSKMGDSLPR